MIHLFEGKLDLAKHPVEALGAVVDATGKLTAEVDEVLKAISTEKYFRMEALYAMNYTDPALTHCDTFVITGTNITLVLVVDRTGTGIGTVDFIYALLKRAEKEGIKSIAIPPFKQYNEPVANTNHGVSMLDGTALFDLDGTHPMDIRLGVSNKEEVLRRSVWQFAVST